MKNLIKSIRLKLFFRICIVIFIIITFFIIVNSVILETFFYYKKNNDLLQIISTIDEFNDLKSENTKKELDFLCQKNNIDIVIKSENEDIYVTSTSFVESFKNLIPVTYNVKYSIFNKGDIMYSNKKTSIRKTSDSNTGNPFIVAVSELKDNNTIYIRVHISSIAEILQISNNFFKVICVILMIIAGIYSFIIAKDFTQPIVDLKEITQKMRNLDFSQKYNESKHDDEINELGKNINDLSEQLEDTINKLKKNNVKLEQDIEEKLKIDEMRKQFISDVSHELKTPIALIQGYAEGLIENVNKDEDSKNFYASVILDEANKMDKLVKRLLELMKLENEEINFNDNNFDIVELINSVIRNSKVMTDEQNIEIEFNEEDSVYVYADEFYIEQVINNYYINAIKNIQEVNGVKKIKISVEKAQEQGKLRVSIFNTGKNIDDEDLNRIWKRFYKVDKSRSRLKGGTGIGLALVKAIITKYNNNYGVLNKTNGVEFYFEINYSIMNNQI